MQIIRVFPRRTKATPTDRLAYVGLPDMFAEADEIHISVTFSWDLNTVEDLEKQWRYVAPVKIGGPATGERSEEFIPGKYIAPGYTITSRGCPNKCWFCTVWRREGAIVRELQIHDGWNVLDDNLLACSDEHIRAVFNMLSLQKERAQFTGGLEAARFEQWHADLLKSIKPAQFFFAYDTPDDLEPLIEAGKKLDIAGFSRKSHCRRAYVLIGFPKDTFDCAEKRLYQTIDAGFMPMAMLYRDKRGDTEREWRKFQREWARPAIINAKMKVAT